MEAPMPRTEQAYQQIRDDRREFILRASARVFAEKGLSNTKISDLAEAAGISQGLLYRYYADKEAVFIAILEHGIGGRVQDDDFVAPCQRSEYWAKQRLAILGEHGGACRGDSARRSAPVHIRRSCPGTAPAVDLQEWNRKAPSRRPSEERRRAGISVR